MAASDKPDHHKYPMVLDVVNENKAVTVLRDLNHEAYHPSWRRPSTGLNRFAIRPFGATTD